MPAEKTATGYLKQELGFSLKEFMALEDADKDWYRTAAKEEMKVLGIPIKKS